MIPTPASRGTAKLKNPRAFPIIEVMRMGRGRPSKCPACHSLKSRSKGYHLNSQGRVKDRECKSCGRRYRVRMKGEKKKPVSRNMTQTETPESPAQV